MNRINLARSELEFDPTDPEGFKAGMLRPGPELGAKNTLCSSRPGQRVHTASKTTLTRPFAS